MSFEYLASHIQTSDAPNVQTPSKKAKLEAPDLNTAETEQQTARKILDNIDDQELFENFDEHIEVTEENRDLARDQEKEVSKKLDYKGSEGISKLDFDQKTSSMKKTTRISYEEFSGIQLFPTEKEEEKISSQKDQADDSQQEQVLGNTVLQTPPKKERKESNGDFELRKDVLKTPRKDHPFRDVNQD